MVLSSLKLNSEKLKTMIFLNLHYRVSDTSIIDCVPESLCKLFEGAPSYGNYQPAV